MITKKLLMKGLLAAVLSTSAMHVMAKELVMGLIPAENNDAMIQKFEPMRAYLQKATGEKVKVYTATDYSSIIEAMKRKKVDIAWFGPLSYVLAEQEAGAEAFAVGVMANGKSSYHSMMVVPANSPIHSLKDLKGKNVAFVDPASTSGGLMPSYMIKKATGEMPQQFFGRLTYAGSHDAAELAVKNRTVDAAADDDITYDLMMQKGLINAKTTRVLITSAPLPGSPLAYRKDLDPALKKKIRDAIVNAHHYIKVSGYGAIVRYDPVGPKDYQLVRNLIKELGLKKEQMLK